MTWCDSLTTSRLLMTTFNTGISTPRTTSSWETTLTLGPEVWRLSSCYSLWNLNTTIRYSWSEGITKIKKSTKCSVSQMNVSLSSTTTSTIQTPSFKGSIKFLNLCLSLPWSKIKYWRFMEESARSLVPLMRSSRF